MTDNSAVPAPFLGVEGLADIPDYATNPARLAHRERLLATLSPLFAARSMAQIIAGLEAASVPVGPVNRLDQALATDQVAARDMVVTMACADVTGGRVRLLGNPLKLSATPVSYRLPPPRFGQDTEAVLGGSGWPSGDPAGNA